MHWLVVRFRGERLLPTGGRSLSKESALLLQRRGHACLCPRASHAATPRGHPRRRHPGTAKRGGLHWGGGAKESRLQPIRGAPGLGWSCPHTFRGTANGIRGNECRPGPGPSEDEGHSRASRDPGEDRVPSHNTLWKTQPLPPRGAHGERLPDRQTADRRAERAGGGRGCRGETLGWETRRAAPASCGPAHCRPRRHKSPGATTRKPHLAEAPAASRPCSCLRCAPRAQ